MHHLRAIALLTFLPLAIFLTPKLSLVVENSLLFMPLEFKTLKKTFEELASANNLGKDPIRMTIVAGYHAAYRSKDLGKCVRKDHNCGYHRDLNPLKKYDDPVIQEILRQAHVNGGYQGWVDESGLISITRSSFYLSRLHPKELSCLLGHELSHVLSDKPFAQRVALWEIEPTGEESELELIDAEVRREAEIQADIDATMLLWRAGYPMRTCKDFRDKLLTHRWYQIPTESDSNYPGYDEWLKRLTGFLEEHKSLERPINPVGTTGRWEFDRALNVLTFIPI